MTDAETGRDRTRGLAAMLGATVIWGLSSLYYKRIAHVPPLEVLAHRTLWSLVFFGLLLAWRGRLGELGRLLGAPRSLGLVALAAIAISLNWFMFIYAIQTGHAVAASLGYYIFPLVAVLLGAAVFGEHLDGLKWAAIAVAATAVAVLTLGLGVAPWISLWLAGTFALYGVAKKKLAAGSMVSVTGEVVLLAPLALLWLWGVHTNGWTDLTGRNLGIFGHDLGDSLLLMFSGVITALPLLLFTTASRNLPLGTVGVMQYINPTLQFAVAALVFAEPVTRWHWIAFPLIWIAVALYSAGTLRQQRRQRRRARGQERSTRSRADRVATSDTTDK
ncbi:MAG: EamA family transporter RarD [Paracoccaceae bacterium]